MIAAACAIFAVASPAWSRDGQAETVAPKFNQAIPNIPGKSLVVVEVDYAPGAASPPHTHAKSAFIFAYVLSGEIESKVNDGKTMSTERARAGRSRPTPPIPSAAMPARRSLAGCSPSSSSIPTTRCSPPP
jgi:hypothetical protein